jgi:hypothetical protein
MKKLNNFLEKAPLWKVFIIGWIVGTIISCSMWSLLLLTEIDVLTLSILLKLSLFFGLFVGGGMLTLLTSMMRSSSKFWEYAKEVEKLVDEANTKQDIIDIEEDEFQKLRKMSIGNPHSYEVRRIFTIMETKYKLLKE